MPPFAIVVDHPLRHNFLQFSQSLSVEEQAPVLLLEATDETLHLGIVLGPSQRIGYTHAILQQ